MDVREWQSLRGLIHDEFYADLLHSGECGPFDGGCVVVAEALQRIVGGEIVVLVRGDDRADHAVVSKDGKLWDYDGPMPPASFIARFNREELSHASWSCVGYRPIRSGDLPNAIRDEALVTRLAGLFEKMLSPGKESIAPSPKG